MSACLWCGSEPEEVRCERDWEGEFYFVHCSECSAQGPCSHPATGKTNRTPEEAETTWGMRRPEARP